MDFALLPFQAKMPLDANKLYCSEILAILLQNNDSKCISVNVGSNIILFFLYSSPFVTILPILSCIFCLYHPIMLFLYFLNLMFLLLLLLCNCLCLLSFLFFCSLISCISPTVYGFICCHLHLFSPSPKSSKIR